MGVRTTNKTSSSGVEPDPRPSQSRVRSPTLQGQNKFGTGSSEGGKRRQVLFPTSAIRLSLLYYLARESNPIRRIKSPLCPTITPARCCLPSKIKNRKFKCPTEESNLVRQFRRLSCVPHTRRASGWNRSTQRALRIAFVLCVIHSATFCSKLSRAGGRTRTCIRWFTKPVPSARPRRRVVILRVLRQGIEPCLSV